MDEPTDRAAELAGRLRDEGHHEAAERVHHAGLAGAAIGLLREACEYVLTAVEALDPKTEMMAEELRLEVEKRLR